MCKAPWWLSTALRWSSCFCWRHHLCRSDGGRYELHSSVCQRYGSGLQVLQTSDKDSTMIYASTDKNWCVSPSQSVRSVVHIVCDPKGPIRLEMRLVWEANINSVLTKKLVQFQLPPANSVSVPIIQPSDSSPVCPRTRIHTRVWRNSRFIGQLLDEVPMSRGRRLLRKDDVSFLSRSRWECLEGFSFSLEKWVSLWEEEVVSACFARGGWDSTTGTWGRSALPWRPSPVARSSFHVPRSGDVNIGIEVAWAIVTRPPLDKVVRARSQALRIERWLMWSRFRRRQARGDAILSAAFPFRSLCSSRHGFFPLSATTIVCSVVTFVAATLKVLFWSDILPRWMVVPASHAPRCIAAVTLRVYKALAAFTLQGPLCGVVGRHFNSMTGEGGERTHFRCIRASRHWHYKVSCQRTAILGVLIIPSPRSKLHESLHTDEHGPRLLSYLGFDHSFP
jgi:hypothetical protein